MKFFKSVSWSDLVDVYSEKNKYVGTGFINDVSKIRVRIVSRNISEFHNENNSLLLITHLNQILKFIRPEFVHVLIDGRIVKEGGSELVSEIEANGFDAYRKEV
mgnify:CR=1 FL=1